MTTSTRRTALLTGASIAAIGIAAVGMASPALAAPHDTHTGTYTGIDTSVDIDLCNVAGSEPCFFGEVDRTFVALATVDDVSEGQIFQHDVGTTFLTIEVATGDSAEVGAVASDTTGANRDARAFLSQAIQQSVHTGSGVGVALENNGNLLVDAAAFASGDSATAYAYITDFGVGQFVGDALFAGAVVDNASNLTIEGVAHAVATEGSAEARASMVGGALPIPGGIVQVATDALFANAYVENHAELNIGMHAQATGTEGAEAFADLDNGIVQFGFSAGFIGMEVYNTALATMNIGALASASAAAGDATASAHVGGGIVQLGLAAGAIGATVRNEGLMNIGAAAYATASGTANADAYLDAGIFQAVGLNDGAALRVYNSAGATMNFGAEAFASGDDAYATAMVGGDYVLGIDEGAINQYATGADATALIDNEGVINVGAFAYATGSDVAEADAFARGVDQKAYGTEGYASNVISGLGTINIEADAVARATGYAHAQAEVEGIEQSAWASSDALVSVDQAALNIRADARAVAGTVAYATALADEGIDQFAYSTDGGSATAHVNIGQLDYLANAFASGTDAQAYAEVGDAIEQDAVAELGGDAYATVTLGVANAVANATALGTTFAYASAENLDFIEQDVTATEGDGYALVDLNGAISVRANAHAYATTGFAEAYAQVTDVIRQDVSADFASAVINNSATLDVIANADATGTSAHAYASVGTVLTQTADGTEGAIASIQNNGDVNAFAMAYASGTALLGDAYASAFFSEGIEQDATNVGSGNADVALVGTGVLNLGAIATANAGSFAYAAAYVSSAIDQNADASEGDSAHAVLSQAAVYITAMADADGARANARAYNSSAIEQYATAGDGDAGVAINLGNLNVNAFANASATSGHATATAYVSNAVEQGAWSTGGDASALLDVTGTLNIHAGARADAASEGAFAYATIIDGIDQRAQAFTGDAYATIDVGSALSIVGQAQAYGAYAFAHANVDNGIDQHAYASEGSAVALIDNDGVIDVDALAIASGSTSGAHARADNYDAIAQEVYSTGGFAASALITGTGSIDIDAFASASADNYAEAEAEVNDAIDQTAIAFTSGNALASISQDAIHVDAVALAHGTSAYATASVNNGVEQYAAAKDGDATAAMVFNTASINAYALAVGSEGNATAEATVFDGISQYAYSTGGDASVSLTNNGELNVTGKAFATATSFATVRGQVFNAVDQYAYASGGGDAQAVVDNNGALNIQALAFGTGTGAEAYAAINQGIVIQASASNSDTEGFFGNANATLANDGAIDMMAYASARGDADFPLGGHSGDAVATAEIDNAIVVEAYAGGGTGLGSGDAFANLTGIGSIDITAKARAVNFNWYAEANAYVTGAAVDVSAFADSGSAAAVISQEGEIDVMAVASAAGATAYASAIVDTGIHQSVFAGNGDANGTINFFGDNTVAAFADVNATEEQGIAVAVVDNAVGQYVTAVSGTAQANIVNPGNLNFIADAHALANDTATAVADVDGIWQQAVAYGSGNATASLVNDGAINAMAFADATGETARAYAHASYGVIQAAGVFGTGDALATFDNNDQVLVEAIANASGTRGYATAYATGGPALVQAAFAPGDVAAANLANDGVMAVVAEAFADAGSRLIGVGPTQTTFVGDAHAFAFASDVVIQAAFGYSASANVDNNVTIADSAVATAIGGKLGVAQAVALGGIEQYATASGTTTTAGGDTVAGVALANVTNNGLIHVRADASATGSSYAGASAFAGSGVRQFAHADGGDATAALSNTATIEVAANADASGAVASAFAQGRGVYQDARAHPYVIGTATYTTPTTLGGTATITYNTDAIAGTALASAFNSGTIAVSADANAVGSSSAFATALAGDGILQVATAGWTTIGTPATETIVSGNAEALVVNEGLVVIDAEAIASASGFASAYAAANTAVEQVVIASQGSAFASVSNTGTILADANAKATAGSTATASAYAVGVGQYVHGTTGGAVVFNSGEISVGAHAYASASSFAGAHARATGIYQTVDPLPVTFINEGSLNVIAEAFATASSGSANATAIGYDGFGFGGGTLTAEIYNGTEAEINVTAIAVAPSTAEANAVGLQLVNDATTTTEGGTVTNTNAQPLEGTFTNDGVINVLASASGGGTYTTVVGTGTTATTTTVYLSSANATGLYVAGGVNNMVITNNGELNVDAVTHGGSPAHAYGIVVESNGDATPGVDDVLTINNSGDIIVRQSYDGGDTWHRGMAIDVARVVNNTVINLYEGNIYGNIDDQDGDQINVLEGRTIFNGIINPECMPAGGPTALELDDPAQNACGNGGLALGNGVDGGTFYMVIDPVDGPSYAFVNDLVINEDATLELDLPPAVGGTIPIGTYPQIFAETVTINGGTLLAHVEAPSGLYETTTYENVIDGTDLTGTFDQCIVDGIPVSSLLLDWGCVYDDEDNVDLRLTRTAFGVPALNDNGTSVGEGLECIYDVNMTGPITNMLADLFLFTDAANYTVALNQLSGSVYANYLQSFQSLGVHHNDILAKATDVGSPGTELEFAL